MIRKKSEIHLIMNFLGNFRDKESMIEKSFFEENEFRKIRFVREERDIYREDLIGILDSYSDMNADIMNGLTLTDYMIFDNKLDIVINDFVKFKNISIDLSDLLETSIESVILTILNKIKY